MNMTKVATYIPATNLPAIPTNYGVNFDTLYVKSIANELQFWGYEFDDAGCGRLKYGDAIIFVNYSRYNIVWFMCADAEPDYCVSFYKGKIYINQRENRITKNVKPEHLAETLHKLAINELWPHITEKIGLTKSLESCNNEIAKKAMHSLQEKPQKRVKSALRPYAAPPMQLSLL